MKIHMMRRYFSSAMTNLLFFIPGYITLKRYSGDGISLGVVFTEIMAPLLLCHNFLGLISLILFLSLYEVVYILNDKRDNDKRSNRRLISELRIGSLFPARLVFFLGLIEVFSLSANSVFLIIIPTSAFLIHCAVAQGKYRILTFSILLVTKYLWLFSSSELGFLEAFAFFLPLLYVKYTSYLRKYFTLIKEIDYVAIIFLVYAYYWAYDSGFLIDEKITLTTYSILAFVFLLKRTAKKYVI